ncbi:MAG: aminotransferase class I/II-fold pyridoxal phosphate-dependent enzyme [Alphaproteobacteria bacterium]
MTRTSTESAAAHGRIPLAVPDLRGNEAAYLLQCVADNWVSSAGPAVSELEARLAALTGRRSAVATVNGTAALHLALKAAGIEAGARVVVPDYTFAATANAVLSVGAVPVFVDVTAETWTLDPALLAATLEAEPDGLAAVIAVHVLGHPADMDPIAALCRRHGATLIEDAAGAIGAAYRGRPAGGLSDIACFSFNGNKTVTAGGGGMLVMDDAAWAERARALSTHARSGAAYRYGEAGFNWRMPNVNAALGLAQLERMDEMVAAKRAIAARYDAALAGRNDLVPMPRAGWADSSCWLYSVRCRDAGVACALVHHLAGRQIEARPFWEALSSQPPYRRFARGTNPVAASLSGTVVTLPCSSHLRPDEQDRVLAALADWRGGAAVADAAGPVAAAAQG